MILYTFNVIINQNYEKTFQITECLLLFLALAKFPCQQNH